MSWRRGRSFDIDVNLVVGLFIYWPIVSGSGEDKDTQECGCASVKKHDHSLERYVLEISVQNSTSNNGGKIEQHELGRYDNFTVELHQSTIKVSDLEYGGNDENLKQSVVKRGKYMS